MTRIIEFEIKGLAGNRQVRHTLSPEVNVFFGLNGTGKTTLLKVLHSAMRNNAASILRLPFSSATVTFYSHNSGITYTRTFDRGAQTLDGDSAEYDLVELENIETVSLGVGEATSQGWTTTPESSRTFADTFLSTSRLAVMNDQRFYPAGRLDRQALQYDEAYLDRMFANQMRQLWRRYSNRALSEVRRIQQNGLAEILQSLFNPASKRESRSLDAKTAYVRAMTSWPARE